MQTLQTTEVLKNPLIMAHFSDKHKESNDAMISAT